VRRADPPAVRRWSTSLRTLAVRTVAGSGSTSRCRERCATRIAGRSRPPRWSQPTTAHNPADVPTPQGARAEPVRYLIDDGRAERSCPAPTVNGPGVLRCRTASIRSALSTKRSTTTAAEAASQSQLPSTRHRWGKRKRCPLSVPTRIRISRADNLSLGRCRPGSCGSPWSARLGRDASQHCSPC
jgi:hypothetical protein